MNTKKNRKNINAMGKNHKNAETRIKMREITNLDNSNERMDELSRK
jgi:hypothetical protein